MNFHRKILNTEQLNWRAQEAHKIKQEELLGCPLWPQVAVELLDWVDQQFGGTCTPVIVAHKAR